MDWHRSVGYRVWVVGGMVVIVGVTLVLGLSNPADQGVIFVLLPMLAVYLGGIFFFQGRAARQDMSDPGRSPMSGRAEEPATGADPPKGWNELSRVLAVKPIDEGAQAAARKASGGMALSQVSYAAVLCLMILIGVGLFYGGVDETLYLLGDAGPGFPIVFLPIFAAIIYGVLRIPFTMRGYVDSSNVHLEPLGLEVTETPRVGVRPRWAGSGMQTDVHGPSVMEGTRHRRKVRVELYSKQYETTVSKRSPSFTVAAKDGKLEPGADAPAAIAKALDALSADSRWRSVEVEGGGDGIVVKRKVRSSEATHALWMDDLWLAERLADAVT
jgi:hypothetical protein